MEVAEVGFVVVVEMTVLRFHLFLDASDVLPLFPEPTAFLGRLQTPPSAVLPAALLWLGTGPLRVDLGIIASLDPVFGLLLEPRLDGGDPPAALHELAGHPLVLGQFVALVGRLPEASELVGVEDVADPGG